MKKRMLIGFGFFLFISLISLIAAAEYFGETSSSVYIKEGIFCPEEYNYTKWVNTITKNSYATVGANPVFDCRDFQDIDGDFVGKGACCPKAGYTFNTCQLVTSSQLAKLVQLLPNLADEGISDRYRCFISNVTSCSSFGSKTTCESSSTKAVAKDSIESSSEYGAGWCNKAIDKPWKIGIKICSNFTSCSCVWNGTSETVGKCLADAHKYWECDDSTKDDYNNEFCQYDINVNTSQCDLPNGIITKTWTVINPPADISDQSGYIFYSLQRYSYSSFIPRFII